MALQTKCSEFTGKKVVFQDETRRLAACTQAVVMMRSTSFIAIELKCSAFEVVRNSIESMCSSYSAFDCISWNRLKIVMSAYGRFSLFSLAFAVVVVCLFVSFLKQERHFEFLSYGVRDIELPWAL